MPKVIFTFKKQPRITGLASIANPFSDTTIKRNGVEVGLLSAQSRFGSSHWDVRFRVKREPEDGNPCPWQWVVFPRKHKTEAEAREWVKQNAAAILAKCDLVEED